MTKRVRFENLTLPAAERQYLRTTLGLQNYGQASIEATSADAVRVEDLAYATFDEFREMVIDHYDGSLGMPFTNKDRFVKILEAFGWLFGKKMFDVVLDLSTLASGGNNHIKSHRVQKAAMNADSLVAFKYCTDAQRDPDVVLVALGQNFNHIHDIYILKTVDVAIARAHPFKFAWWLTCADGSVKFKRLLVTMSSVSVEALSIMASEWLRNPKHVYKHRYGMNTPRLYNVVSDVMVRNVLAHLFIRGEYKAWGGDIAYRVEIHHLLGMTYRLGVEIRSWHNKMTILTEGDGSRVLFSKSIAYTVEGVKTAMARGAAYREKTLQPGFVPRFGARYDPRSMDRRRGDSILKMFHEAGRADLLALVADFVLHPLPPRFKPLGKPPGARRSLVNVLGVL